MKKLALITVSSLTALALATTAQAGGRGGSEIGVAAYGGGVGIVGSVGFPIRVATLEDNSLNTYGEVELGVGFEEDIAFGGDASLGLLLNLERGLDLYGSLGPGLGSGRNQDAQFGLAGEVGMNLLLNETNLFIEGGTHPGNGYFAVGMRF